MLYFLTITAVLFILYITALSNFLLFPRVKAIPNRQIQSPVKWVSILIPARNEEEVIEKTLTRLQNQTYPHFECLVLNDNSEDKTAELVQAIATQDERFQLIQGKPLAAGWLGKNWACHQLSEQAAHEQLLFCDADVQWEPRALERLMAQFSHRNADCMTVWPSQITVSWGERLIVPLMKFTILAYLPIIGVHYLPFSIFAAANGQCLLFKKEAYTSISGHVAVRQAIVEDVELARNIKQNGYRLRMIDGNREISCRMYSSWEAVLNGFGKNILAGHGNSLPFLAVSTLFHWAVFVVPWIWLILGGLLPNFIWLYPLTLISAAVGLRIFVELFVRADQPAGMFNALLMPLSVLLMTRIAWRGCIWYFSGGPEWKGRKLGAQLASEKSNG
ncbi:MAG: glycosyltransferase family 2 protein [Chloroflexota bacterium]